MKRVKSWKLLLIGTSMALGVSACGGTGNGDAQVGESAAEVAVLELAHVGDKDSPQQSIAELFAENLEDAEAGIELDIHDSGTLGNEQELQGGVIDGSIDIIVAGTLSHYASWAGVLETPMLFTSNDDFKSFATGDAGKEVAQKIGEELGVQVLFIAPHEGPRYITTKSKPIYSPEDMKGLRLRNPEVPAFTLMADAVGANPVALDFSELYLALDRGVVEGQHNPLSHVVGQSFYEVQDYLSLVPWGISPHIVTISDDAWQSLSEAQQETLREAAAETADEYFTVAEADATERLEFLEDKMTVVDSSEIDLDAFLEVFDERGLPGIEGAYGAEGSELVQNIIETR